MIFEIATYVANHTSFVLGTTLFCGMRPESAPDRCIAFLDRVAGQADFYLHDRVDYRLQVISRALTYDLAYTDIWTIHAFLNGLCAVDLPIVYTGHAYHIATAETVNAPATIGLDPRGRFEYSANYLLRIQKP